jgi:hypothetical protein
MKLTPFFLRLSPSAKTYPYEGPNEALLQAIHEMAFEDSDRN